MDETRRILITGSSSGIGAAIARRLAGPGARIMVHARQNRAGCERVAADLAALGAETAIRLADLRDPAATEAMVDEAVRLFGGLDVLVANAGFPELKLFGDLSRADLDRCYEVIGAGFFHLATRALPSLQTSDAGRVVAVSTLNAHVFRPNYPLNPASAAAKAALEALCAASRSSLRPRA